MQVPAFWWLFAVLILFISPMAWIAVSVSLHVRLLRRLRLAHHLLWVDLGAPTPLSVAPFVIRFFGGLPSPYALSGSKYLDWLVDNSDSDLGDAEVAHLAQRIRRLSRVTFRAIAIALLLLLIALYLTSNKRWRGP
jgi:hypothetical protein